MSPVRRFLVAVGAAAILAAALVGCRGGDAPPGPAASTAALSTPASPPPASPPPASSPGPSTPAPSPGAGPGLASPRPVGTFDLAAVPEASGLVASRRNPSVLYVLDDATGTRGVLAIRTDGSTVGRVDLVGLDARDTEDLAVAPCGPDDPASCLYVGDIGDNLASRDTVDVWRVPEPDLGPGAPTAPLEATRARLRYPDGPRDAEALVVDDRGAPFLITKAPDLAGVYAADGMADQTLRRVADLPLPEPAVPLASAVVGHVVTAADARDGVVLVRTYDAVFRYTAADPAAPLETFPRWPVAEVPSPTEVQGEALATAADGCGYYTAGEGVGDLWHVPCAAPELTRP